MKKKFMQKYFHWEVENNKYSFWQDNGYFKGDINSKKHSFSIIIPPPNITGKLHLGHAWDATLQDIIIRYKKLNGYNTLYLPGMDHAGIATQTKFEEVLRTKQNLSRNDLGRNKFIEEIWKLKEECACIIRKQWAKLGLSLDYSKEQFTLNDNLSQAVRKVFVELYKRNLIYRGKKIISWDPKLQTALSNIEVIYKEIEGKMYYFKYFLENSSTEYLVIATTRPETMFADQCVIVNPLDERYKKYWNMKVINPSNNMLIPIICESYVKMDFGTGVMKCTPAHDFNDFEIGLRHNLKMPTCINVDGTMNDLANKYKGQDRYVARENLVNDLKIKKILIKVENCKQRVGFSERSNTIVEPYLSDQWFVKMQSLADKVIENQNCIKKIEFIPDRFNETLLNWMNNIQDWCISRQLWWGHQIPVWYNKNNSDDIYVGLIPPKDIDKWNQDSDVLDTWFSSALWPFVALGWGWNEKLLNCYFPTNVLVTGYDIIFFWVSRMIFQSLEFTNKIPFKCVLVHGLIRDNEGKKMSKSLNNGIDPISIIETYGADSLRYFLMSNTSPGNDLKYSQEKIKFSWNFINKIWNASRYLLLNLPDNFRPINNFEKYIKKVKKDFKENEVNYWILNELSNITNILKFNMKKYEFISINKNLYDFIWNKYCSWYIELSKINLTSDNNIVVREFTYQTMFYILKQILIILHPFIPFVTEEIYQYLNLKKSIMLEKYPKINFNFKIFFLNDVFKITNCIREFRHKENINNKVKLELELVTNSQKMFLLFKLNIVFINTYIFRLVNSIITNIFFRKNITTADDYSDNFIIFPLDSYIIKVFNKFSLDKNNEKEYLLNEIISLEKELLRSKKILNNKDFLNKANINIINIEKEKYHRYLARYKQLKESTK